MRSNVRGEMVNGGEEGRGKERKMGKEVDVMG